MAYDYRKMSPDERAAVVAYRKERRYPLHSPPHPIRRAGWYFIIIVVNFEHQPIMASPERRDEFETRLLNGYREINAKIAGWVILANHHHSLAGVNSLDDVSKMMQRLHGSTSYEWNRADEITPNGKSRTADLALTPPTPLSQ